MKILYETSVTATGGREGRVQSNNGVLSLALAIPKELGGPGGQATNPEQLFAAGYAACFESAIRYVARSRKIPISNLHVTADIGIGNAESGVGFALSARLRIEASDLDRETVQVLVNEAHQICPYSKATRGNIDVGLVVV